MPLALAAPITKPKCVSIERGTNCFKTALERVASVCTAVQVFPQMELRRSGIEVGAIANYLSSINYNFKNGKEDGGPDRHCKDPDSDTTSCTDLTRDSASQMFAERRSTVFYHSSCSVQHPAQDCSVDQHISPHSSPCAGKEYISDDSDGHMQHDAGMACSAKLLSFVKKARLT